MGEVVRRKDDTARKRRRPWAARILRLVVKTIVALALGYVVVINVFLSTSLFEKVIDGQPETIDIHYQSAWSVIPGRIHGKGISIRGRDSHVEWMLRIDRADFDMSFAALVRQRFEVSQVHGTGISFRVRQRLDAPPATPEEVANLPFIDGFGTYSVRPGGGPGADLWSDVYYHLWTAHLENVVADDVREVWIDEVRFQGSARIAGRFYLKPLRAVSVGPLRIDLHRGAVRQGAAVLIEDLGGGRIDGKLAEFDPRTANGAAVLHHISVAVDVHGACPDLAALPFAPPGTLAGPVVVNRLALEVTSGVVSGEGHFDVRAPRAVVQLGEHRLTGVVALTGDVARDPKAPRDVLRARAVVSSFAAGRGGASEPFLRVEELVGNGDSRELDLARPLGDLHFDVAFHEGEVAHARDLSAYVPKTTAVAFMGGRARVEGNLEAWLEEKRARGAADLRADDLDVQLAKVRVRGSTSAHVSFASWRWDTRKLEDATLALQISRGSLATESAPTTALVHVSGLRVDAHGTNADLDDPLRDLDVAIDLPEGRVADRALLKAYLPKGEAMQIAFGRFAATCHAVVADHIAKGTIEVQSKRLRLEYAGLALAADVRAKARVHAWHWEHGDLALDDARVDVRDVRVTRRGLVEAGVAPVSVERISLHAKSSRFAFADPLARVTLDAAMQGGQVKDAAVLNAFLPEGSTFALDAEDGRLAGEVHAEVVGHVARGTVAVRGENVGIVTGSVRLRGDPDVTAEVSEWDLTKDTTRVLGSRMIVTNARGSLRREGAWDASVDRVELDARTDKLDLARPTLRGVDGRLVIANAVLPDATSLKALLPPDGIVAIESGRADVGADVTLSATEKTATGKIDVTLTRAGVRFHEVHVLGDFRLTARIVGFDPERGVVDLSGSTLAMRDVAVTNASTNAAHWHADAVMNKTSLRLSPPELATSLSLDADDASPVLAVLLGDDLPGILAGMTHMHRLLASARLVMRTHEFAFCDIDAHGSDLAFRGCYVVRGDRRHGAFVVRKGLFSVGLWLGNTGGAKVRFFGLDGWLRGETAHALRLWGEK